MTEPKPRVKYLFHKLNKDNPLKIEIVDGDRSEAMRALRAAYAWGRRNGKVLFGKTEVIGDKTYLIIRRHYPDHYY